jgi:hypothetical protein
LRRILLGISNRIYGMKKIISAALYFVPDSMFRSSLMPSTAALPMFTLGAVSPNLTGGGIE